MSFLKVSFFSILLRVTGVLLGFGLTVLLARFLGTKEYGSYAYAIAIMTLLAVPAQVGLPTLVTRETVLASSNRDWGLLKGLWCWSFLAVMASSALIAVGLLAYFSIHDFESEKLFLIIVPIIILTAINNIRGAAVRGLNRVVLGQFPEVIIRPACLIAFVLAANFFYEITAESTLILYALAALTSFIIGSFILYKIKPKELSSRINIKFNNKVWAVSCLSLGLISGLMLINQQMDVILLGILSSKEEVALYKVALSCSILVGFALESINMVLSPAMSRYFQSGDKAGLQKIATFSSIFAFSCSLLMFLVFLIFGKGMLKIFFGLSYESSYFALLILSLGQVVSSFSGSVGMILNMSNNETHSLRGIGIAAMANVTLNIILIPKLGIEGAALATAISLIVWNFFLWRVALRRVGVDSSVLSFFKRN